MERQKWSASFLGSRCPEFSLFVRRFSALWVGTCSRVKGREQPLIMDSSEEQQVPSELTFRLFRCSAPTSLILFFRGPNSGHWSHLDPTVASSSLFIFSASSPLLAKIFSIVFFELRDPPEFRPSLFDGVFLFSDRRNNRRPVLLCCWGPVGITHTLNVKSELFFSTWPFPFASVFTVRPPWYCVVILVRHAEATIFIPNWLWLTISMVFVMGALLYWRHEYSRF